MPTIPEMLVKLNGLYDKEENLLNEIKRLVILFEEVKEEKEMLQTMIMFQSNKQSREKELKKC